jgi:hypothetical protein
MRRTATRWRETSCGPVTTSSDIDATRADGIVASFDVPKLFRSVWPPIVE